MNYPLISEYIESIKLAEDNFEELSYLRPVLDNMGQPVMSSGNFAVVFKMKDERDGKLYAVRCFHRDQEGREESYRLIEEELKDVESPYLVSFRYIDKELFVDSSQTDETEFPVLLMDWVEGITLDKYLRENIDDQYALEMLAYRFSQLTKWLILQPFAHGDLKPDNILVREDGTLVLVDYDGMYVPAMKGQKARELGSPDFRHPLRTEDDFDEHIDDFPLVSILLSLKAISVTPQLLEEYGATDRLLLSERDYRDIANSTVLRLVLTQITNAAISRIYSLFVITLSEKKISEDSYKLVFEEEHKRDLYSIYKKLSRYDNDSKYCLSCLLMNGFGCKQDFSAGWDLIVELAEHGFARAQFQLGKYFYAHRNYKMAFEWISKAVDNGYVRGFYYLGNCYQHGKGVDKDYVKAFEYFSLSAERGDTFSLLHLSYLYTFGLGVKQDYDKAVGYLIKAIEREQTLFYPLNKNLTRVWDGEFKYDWKRRGFGEHYSPDGTRCLGAFDFIPDCHYKIEDGTKIICDRAFYKCLDIVSVSIPNSVVAIGEQAFYGCRWLKTVNMPNHIIIINDYAFEGCVSLETISLSDSIRTIGKSVFSYCSKLHSIIIPKGSKKKFEKMLPYYKEKLEETAVVEPLNNDY